MQKARHIGLLALPGIEALELAGPYDVFRRAVYFTERDDRSSPYSLEVIGIESGVVNSESGLKFLASRGFKDVSSLDTLIVVGGYETPFLPLSSRVITWLQLIAGRTRRVCGICSGAFALAEAGLLDGRKAVCHWGHAELFRERYPEVLLDADPLFLQDGSYYTSAGVTAGMDLALALVEEDLGPALALTVARSMVMFLKRPGNQSQFSFQLSLQTADRAQLRELQAWIPNNLNGDLSVKSLSTQAAMSPRNFARVFLEEVGITPSRYVERVRLDAARRRLEESSQPIKAIAAQTGLGSVESMRRLFEKTLNVTPAAYRSRFRTSLGRKGAE